MGVTLTPNLTPNLGSFLLLKKSSFDSQSGSYNNSEMGLFLLLTWVVFTLFGVTLTLKVELNFKYRITPFWGYFNSSISGVTFTPEKELFRLLFGVKITP